jgi:hypothetical protein
MGLPNDNLRLSLRNSERAWISFRDSECTFESSTFSGVTSGWVLENCKACLSIERTNELKQDTGTQPAALASFATIPAGKVTIDYPKTGVKITSMPKIGGTIQMPSKIAWVKIKIHDDVGGKVWNGVKWVYTDEWLGVTVNNNTWIKSSGLPKQSDLEKKLCTLYIDAQAADESGHLSNLAEIYVDVKHPGPCD